MCFVGPRPALYNQIDLIDLRIKNGIEMLKPGITGWAQINGQG
jgi:O-antigen biosynthesis protein WbqP